VYTGSQTRGKAPAYVLDGRVADRTGVLQVGQVGVADLRLDCKADAIGPFRSANAFHSNGRVSPPFVATISPAG